jgi:hypothetical protein
VIGLAPGLVSKLGGSVEGGGGRDEAPRGICDTKRKKKLFFPSEIGPPGHS